MRRSSSLVAYSDSEDSSEDVSKPKRKLPKLSPSLTVPVPLSDPTQHQGRIRTTPHVEGQFAAFVYVPVPLPSPSPLRALLNDAVHLAKDIEPAMQSEWLENSKHIRELHISLTRPLYLRHYQREELRRVVKAVARTHESFTASFSRFSIFDNDEHTRTFLSAEIGAGHSEMKRLSESLEPTLHLLHQKKYYSEPRFHTSIAWAVLSSCRNGAEESTSSRVAGSDSECSNAMAFKSISLIPPSLVPELNDRLAAKLSTGLVGIFEASTICVKIGKEVFSWDLGQVKQ